MASVKALTDLTLRDLWREVKDPATLWGGIPFLSGLICLALGS